MKALSIPAVFVTAATLGSLTAHPEIIISLSSLTAALVLVRIWSRS